MRFKIKTIFKNSIYRTFIIITFISLVIYIIVKDHDFVSYRNFFSTNESGNKIKLTCHNQTVGDALHLLKNNFAPPPKSIFMHETSCRGDINSRQECAIESAARAHPNWNIYILFSGPISGDVLERKEKLLNYKNVKLLRIHLEDYAKGTPVEVLFKEKPFDKSKWAVPHLSDALRYLTLYKYGGVYIDMDVIVVKPFDSLASNWAGREDSETINSAVMSLSRNTIGRIVAEATIHDFREQYDPNKWNHNGPGVITRVVKELCSKNGLDWRQGCDGFVVYDPEVFYPVYYTKHEEYFKENYSLNTSDKTYVHHLWNALSYKDIVPEKSSLYVMLAKQYCPNVYAKYGLKFGI